MTWRSLYILGVFCFWLIWMIVIFLIHRRVSKQINLVYDLRYYAIIFTFLPHHDASYLEWFENLPDTKYFIRIGRWRQPDYRLSIAGRYADEFWEWKAALECWKLDKAEQELLKHEL